MDILNRDTVPAFTTKDGSTIREILAPHNSSLERQSLAEATLLPGQETQAHLHPNTEELYYLLRGSGRMALGQEQRSVGPGDAVSIPAGQKHQIRNTGTTDLVFLCCCAPAYLDLDTVMCEPLLPSV